MDSLVIPGLLFPLLLPLLCCAGCGTIPDALVLVRSPRFYGEPLRVTGAQGPLSTAQGEAIVAQLSRQSGSPDVLARHLAFEQAISGAPLILGNRVTLLENGAQTYPAMLSAIRAARESINLETYIFSDDALGRVFAGALIARRRAGVRVNIIYDGFGSHATPEVFFDTMRAAGIRVLEFNPIAPWRGHTVWAPDHRDHRKLLIVDGKIVFTGGMNISGSYLGGSGSLRERRSDPKFTSRDTDVEVEGPAVSAFQRLFFTTWRTEHGAPLNAADYFPVLLDRGHDIVRVLGSVPEQFTVIYLTLVSAVNNAESNIYITDAYFAPDAQMLEALEGAARRGVDVRLLVPGKTNEPFIGPATRSHYSELLRAGVKIYQWRGRMLHAKTATIDGVWSTVGSSNLDWWSIARNNEVNLVILNTEFAARMSLMFFNDLEDSDRIDLQHWEKRSLAERIDETFAGYLQRML
ncbi:MAG TPA: phospholipase D-like domain-containing protein [Candidatus Binataceae bacterium]|nr:phospholipase D-like domain-containing protein [Candidatus Binataceae bacterium]